MSTLNDQGYLRRIDVYDLSPATRIRFQNQCLYRLDVYLRSGVPVGTNK